MWAGGVPGGPGDADVAAAPCRDLPIIVKSVNSEGGLLRLGGTYDVRTTLLLEVALSELAPRLRGAQPLHQSAVRPGVVVAVSENGNFVRAAITNVYPLRVRSMDSWGEREVALEELRPLNDAPELIRGAPPQHIELVVARVAHPRGVWDKETLTYLRNLLLDKEVMYKIEFMADDRRFAGVRFDNCDLSEFLIYHNVGASADVKQQMKMLRSSLQARSANDLQERTDRRAPALLQTKFARNVAVPRPLNRLEDSPKSPTSPTSAGPLAYNGPPLEADSQHRVHVSYARDGPELFAVQLESDEEKLISIMKEISSQPLVNITEPPIIGTVCLGKFSEDGTVCRAVVTGLADNKCRLYFVDFGMTELVSSRDIYHIPRNLVAPRVLAFRFCLSGIKKMTVDEDLKRVFHTLVHNKVLTLRVTTPEDPPLVQYCELFLNGHNIKDILKSNDPSTLHFESIPTSNIVGRLKVIVSFVDSCTKFFVQLAEYSEKLTEVMDLVDRHSTNASSLQFHEIKNGMPCCAMYPDDRKWYRALVTNIKKDQITVNYVDYGNDQELTADNIKPITRALLLLPIQALHCALKGYEDKPFSAKLSSQLEELTVETELTMNVYGTLGTDIFLVDLINDKTVPSTNISDQLKQFESQELFTSPQDVDSSYSPDNSAKQPNFETPSNTQYKKHREENTYSSGGSGYDKKKFRNKSSMDDRLKFNEEPDNSNFSDNYNSQRQDFDFKPENDFRKKRENVKKNFHPPQRKKEKDEANNGSSSLTSYPPKRNNFKGHSEKKRNTSSDFVKQNHRWNGSDRNFKSQGKKFNSPKANSYSQDHSYKSSSTTSKVLNNPAPYDATFKEFVPNSTIDVRVSWIVNPDQFYVQILSLWNDFEAMMDRIPIIYEGIKPSVDMISAGSCVLALFPEDNSVYRAEVLENKGFDSYLVFFVDFGNTCVVQCNHVWPLDNDLLELPKMALKCSLKGVSPVEKEWSANNQEDKYFNGSLYRCDFISKYLDSYVVTLTDKNGSTVKDNLINDNLAVAGDSKFIPKYEGENLELNMLVGQNIYAQICQVEAMTKFYVCVDPFVESFDNNVSDVLSTNKPVECALHNFDPESSQLLIDESDFKSLENQYILIYVDDVCDTKLLVTLYDQKTGLKMECFTPDDGAYESIPSICPHPVFSKDFGSTYATHVESINEIYLQRNKNSGLISSLLELLYTFYSVQGNCHDLENVEVDAICAAKSHDENWYRAKIVEIHPDECKVQYIDYGNSETVSKTYIKILDSQFYPFYEQAVVCGLEVASSENVVVDELRNQIHNQELNVTLALDDIGWVSNIIVNGENVTQNLNKKKLNENIVIEKKISKPVSADKPKNEPISALVSHIDSPGQFWLQLTSETEKLDELGSIIQAEVQNLEDLTNCDIGKTCIAKYSADEQYYRAVILDSDSDIITVRFTDYGNTDVLDNAPGILKCLPENLAVIKPYVIKCSVNAFPASMGEWTEPATSLFTQLIGDKEKPVEAIIILVDSTTYVDIHVNGINITQKLVEAGYAVLNEKQDDGELLTCFTSHINSPSEFWVHLESSVSDLELVSEQLIDAENFAPITEIEEEVICAAKFPEDDNWYRAKIIIHGSDGTEVLFMDYGNASLTDELRNLPEKLKNMPALSRKCALQKPANIKSWSKEAELKFTQLAAEGATVFHISFVATGDISIVELYLNNKSITEQLISLCDTSGTTDETIEKNKILPTVHMTCSNGPNDFWIQYNSYADQLNTVMNALMDAEDFDTLEDKLLGSLCVSLFSDDNMWYRSLIISVNADEIKVVHIDYGLTATTSTLKRIPEELIYIPPLAKNCCLALPENCDKFDQNDNKAFAKISAKQSQIYYIEIVDSSKEPEIVNLYIKQNEKFVNILKQLKDKKVDDLSCDVPVSQNLTSSSVAEKTTIDVQNFVTEDSNSTIESQNIIVESNISNSSDIPVLPNIENSFVPEKATTDVQNVVIEDLSNTTESQNGTVESNISNSIDIPVLPDIKNSSVGEKATTDVQNVVIEDLSNTTESQNVIVESNISNSSDIPELPDIENSFVAEKATTDVQNFVIEDLKNTTESQNVTIESNISKSSDVNSESLNSKSSDADGIDPKDDFDSDVKDSDEKPTINSNEPEVLNIQNDENVQIVSENTLEESDKSASDLNSSDSQLELSPSKTNITKCENIHKDDMDVPKLPIKEEETLKATDLSVSEGSCNLSIESQSSEMENSKDLSDNSNSTNKEENNSQSVTEIQNIVESTDSVTEIQNIADSPDSITKTLNIVESTDSVTEIQNIVESIDSVTIHSNDILSSNDTDTNLIKPKITVTDENDDIVNDNIDIKKKLDSSKEKLDGAVEKVDREGFVSVEQT